MNQVPTLSLPFSTTNVAMFAAGYPVLHVTHIYWYGDVCGRIPGFTCYAHTLIWWCLRPGTRFYMLCTYTNMVMFAARYPVLHVTHIYWYGDVCGRLPDFTCYAHILIWRCLRPATRFYMLRTYTDMVMFMQMVSVRLNCTLIMSILFSWHYLNDRPEFIQKGG